MINHQIGSPNTMMNDTVVNRTVNMYKYIIFHSVILNCYYISQFFFCISSPLVCCFQPSLATQKTESFTLYLIQGAQWNLKTNSVHIIVELSVLFPKLKLNCFQKYFAFAWLSLIKMGGLYLPQSQLSKTGKTVQKCCGTFVTVPQQKQITGTRRELAGSELNLGF